MLKAILIFILICVCVDNVAFDGYYRFVMMIELKELYHHFIGLRWTGLFIPPSR